MYLTYVARENQIIRSSSHQMTEQCTAKYVHRQSIQTMQLKNHLRGFTKLLQEVRKPLAA